MIPCCARKFIEGERLVRYIVLSVIKSVLVMGNIPGCPGYDKALVGHYTNIPRT